MLGGRKKEGMCETPSGFVSPLVQLSGTMSPEMTE